MPYILIKNCNSFKINFRVASLAIWALGQVTNPEDRFKCEEAYTCIFLSHLSIFSVILVMSCEDAFTFLSVSAISALGSQFRSPADQCSCDG